MTLDELASSDTIMGIWWPPGQSRRARPGRLTLSDLELVLHGRFERRSEEPPRKYGILHGRAPLGEQVTLVSCLRTRQVSAALGSESSFVASFALLGRHLRHESLRFQRVWLSANWLRDWVNTLGFQVEHDYKSQKVVVRYTAPPSLRLAETADTTVSLHFAYSAPFTHHDLSAATIEQQPVIEICLASPAGLQETLSNVWRVESFLSFALGKAALFESFSLGHKSYVRRRHRPRQSREDPRLIVARRRPASTTSKGSRNQQFTWSEMSCWAAGALDQWLINFERLGPVIGLYSSELERQGSFSFHRLLGLLNAVEGYHRRMCCTAMLPPEQHQERIAAIVQGCPRKWRRWLTGKLKYSNDPALPDRIKEVVGRAAKARGETITLTQQKIDTLVATRNFLSHYDTSLERRALSDQAMVPATYFLRSVLELCFLADLGFPPEAVATLTRNNDGNWRLQNALGTEWPTRGQ